MVLCTLFYLTPLLSTVSGEPAWLPSFSLHLGYGEIDSSARDTDADLLGGLAFALFNGKQEFYLEAAVGPTSSYRHRGTTQTDYEVKASALRLGYLRSLGRPSLFGHLGYAVYEEGNRFSDAFGTVVTHREHRGLAAGLGVGFRLTRRLDAMAQYDRYLGSLAPMEGPITLATDKFSALAVKLRWRFGGKGAGSQP